MAICLPTCNLSCNSLLCKVREATFACSRAKRSCWSASELISNKLSPPGKRKRQFKYFFKWLFFYPLTNSLSGWIQFFLVLTMKPSTNKEQQLSVSDGASLWYSWHNARASKLILKTDGSGNTLSLVTCWVIFPFSQCLLSNSSKKFLKYLWNLVYFLSLPLLIQFRLNHLPLKILQTASQQISAPLLSENIASVATLD